MADGEIIKASSKATDTLAKALLKFQESAPEILRSADSNRGKYAPLDVVLDAVRPELSKCGIVAAQITKVHGEMLWVETRLIHAETGEIQSSEYPVGHVSKQHQELGAGLTYARRYALLAALNLCPQGEDKDAERAGRAGRRAGEPQQTSDADLQKAGQALRVKLMGAVSEADLGRIWGRNARLREVLAGRAPDMLRKLDHVFSERRADLQTKGGDDGADAN